MKEFFKWLATLGKNIYDITLYAIKKPWFPENVSLEKTVNNTMKIFISKEINNSIYSNFTNATNNN